MAPKSQFMAPRSQLQWGENNGGENNEFSSGGAINLNIDTSFALDFPAREHDLIISTKTTITGIPQLDATHDKGKILFNNTNGTVIFSASGDYSGIGSIEGKGTVILKSTMHSNDSAKIIDLLSKTQISQEASLIIEDSSQKAQSSIIEWIKSNRAALPSFIFKNGEKTVDAVALAKIQLQASNIFRHISPTPDAPKTEDGMLKTGIWDLPKGDPASGQILEKILSYLKPGDIVSHKDKYLQPIEELEGHTEVDQMIAASSSDAAGPLEAQETSGLALLGLDE